MYVVLDKKLKLYAFPNHPFGKGRYEAFEKVLKESGLIKKIKLIKARKASQKELLLFHEKSYIDFVKEKSVSGIGLLDYGDTPAFKGCYDACCYIVGGVLNAVDVLAKVNGEEHAFVPIAGLHHAYANRAAGFCIFNDICIAINYLRKNYSINKILYFDIDAHHGDGVFYSFEEDDDVFIVDFHQMPLYPGTGYEHESGRGKVKSKLNIPLANADDKIFEEKLVLVREFLADKKVDFIIMQAGVDSMKNDPLASLAFENAHSTATKFLLDYAKKWNASILALGGGGYNLNNIAKGWLQIVETLMLL